MKYIFVLFILLLSCCSETTPVVPVVQPVAKTTPNAIPDILGMEKENIKKAYINGWLQGASAAITLYRSKNFNKQTFDLLLLRDSLAFANLIDRK